MLFQPFNLFAQTKVFKVQDFWIKYSINGRLLGMFKDANMPKTSGRAKHILNKLEEIKYTVSESRNSLFMEFYACVPWGKKIL